MSRPQKEAHLAELEATLKNAKGVVFANYHGMKVKEFDELRHKLREQGMRLRVTKNRILRLALRRLNLDFDESMLDQPLVMAGSSLDELAAAKVIQSFVKNVETLKVVGGLLGERFLTPAEVFSLAALPGQDELRAKLVGILSAPLTNLVYTLQAPLTNLVSVLKQYREQKA